MAANKPEKVFRIGSTSASVFAHPLDRVKELARPNFLRFCLGCGMLFDHSAFGPDGSGFCSF